MKKFWNLMLAALVIIGAAACTENYESIEKAEGFSFYAEIVNDTRATIADEDGDKTWETKWELGDKLYVNGTYEFVCTDVETGKFTCNDNTVAELAGTNVTVTTDGKHHSLEGKSAFYTTANVENFGEGKVELQALTSFFRFTYNGEVKFTLSEPLFRTEEGTAVNEITVSGNGEQFVAFWPTGEEVTLSYAVSGKTLKEATKVLAAGMVYNLGTLVSSNVSEYGVVGSFQGWDVAVGKPVKMTYVASDWNWVVAENVELYKSDEFKIVKGNSWSVSFGGSSVFVAEDGKEYTLVSSNGQNIKAAKNGKFNIYFNPTSKKFKCECVEEYTDLMVNITINNKANWSPLYITLKDGNNVIADNATVTNNVYQVSGDHIGKNLTCTLSNGSKTSEAMSVAIAKTGATVTLEETIIKFTFKLDTANAKQWWGDKTYMYVWESGSSLDVGWPGNAMTSEGNYTWSIIVPSELVGKKINYIINNGSGWQSPNQTIVISSNGNNVTETSIGIK